MAETYNDRVSHTEHATRFIKQRVSDISPTLDSDDDPTSKKRKLHLKPALLTSVLAGGIAGVIVDISLYPLDTVKTRLQSKEGFRASGGFRGIYNGIWPVLLGSAPISALFFATYNTLINTLRTENSALNPLVYLVSATCAETVSASVRVPIEIVKQRNQTTNNKSSYIIKMTLKKEGIPGFYRGFSSTLMREIPFAAIQYPLWEYMLHQVIIYEHGKELTALQTAYCGAAAGAVAAAITTPMDVVKTRIMLAEKEKIDRYKTNLNYYFAKEVYRERGISGLFAGTIPRVLWIMLGGFIYFGAYEKAKKLCESKWDLFIRRMEKEHHPEPIYMEEKLDVIVFPKDDSWEGTSAGEEFDTKEYQEQSNSEHKERQNVLDTTLLQPFDGGARN